MGLRVTSRQYKWYLSPRSVQGRFGAVRCIFLKMTCYTTTTGHSVKWNEIWDSEHLVEWIWAIIYFYCLSSVWGHLVHFSQNGP